MDQFRQVVQEYVELHEQIEKAKEQIKLIHARKLELEKTIKTFMEENRLQAIDTAAGKIKLLSSQTKPPIKRDLMGDLLTEKLGPTIANQVLQIVYDERQPVTAQKVKVVKR